MCHTCFWTPVAPSQLHSSQISSWAFYQAAQAPLKAFTLYYLLLQENFGSIICGLFFFFQTFDLVLQVSTSGPIGGFLPGVCAAHHTVFSELHAAVFFHYSSEDLLHLRLLLGAWCIVLFFTSILLDIKMYLWFWDKTQNSLLQIRFLNAYLAVT